MRDPAAGRRFYERQGTNLGDYFYRSLFAADGRGSPIPSTVSPMPSLPMCWRV